jgi:hypothetical protein
VDHARGWCRVAQAAGSLRAVKPINQSSRYRVVVRGGLCSSIDTAFRAYTLDAFPKEKANA